MVVWFEDCYTWAKAISIANRPNFAQWDDRIEAQAIVPQERVRMAWLELDQTPDVSPYL